MKEYKIPIDHKSLKWNKEFKVISGSYKDLKPTENLPPDAQNYWPEYRSAGIVCVMIRGKHQAEYVFSRVSSNNGESLYSCIHWPEITLMIKW